MNPSVRIVFYPLTFWGLELAKMNLAGTRHRVSLRARNPGRAVHVDKPVVICEICNKLRRLRNTRYFSDVCGRTVFRRSPVWCVRSDQPARAAFICGSVYALWCPLLGVITNLVGKQRKRVKMNLH